eukprot:3747895-Pyramimonas_sp.AAC.1
MELRPCPRPSQRAALAPLRSSGSLRASKRSSSRAAAWASWAPPRSRAGRRAAASATTSPPQRLGHLIQYQHPMGL